MEKIQQTIEFAMSPEEFYNTILDAGKHSAFTQSKAEINDVVGDSYTTYDGYIEGTNLNLIPGKLIVQSWKAYEEEWPENHFSTITFRISSEKKGCKIEFTHEEIPDGMGKMYEEGWKENYWDKLKVFFKK
jgi:activator of HSP90 ATPase